MITVNRQVTAPFYLPPDETPFLGDMETDEYVSFPSEQSWLEVPDAAQLTREAAGSGSGVFIGCGAHELLGPGEVHWGPATLFAKADGVRIHASVEGPFFVAAEIEDVELQPMIVVATGGGDAVVTRGRLAELLGIPIGPVAPGVACAWVEPSAPASSRFWTDLRNTWERAE